MGNMPHLFLQEFSKSKEVETYIQNQIAEKKIAGAVVLIQKEGKILLHKSFGKQDIEDKIQMDTSSIFRIYSMTKPLTSLSVMLLVDRDSISLDDPIVKYIPELNDLKVVNKKKLKRGITVRDLLRHTSGFAYGLGLGFSKVDLMYNVNHPLFVANGDDMIGRLSDYPLKSQPGEHFNYSISIDVLGVLVERISGKSLGEFMTENIFIPLGMKDSHFQLPQEKTARFCSIYGVGLQLKESYKDSEYSKKRFEAGGGGLVSTTSDYLKFSNLMLNKGIYGNDTLISPSLIDEMTINQLPEGEGVYKQKGEVAIGFGLGFSVNLMEWGNFGHKGDYGWSGIGGTHFVISPKEEIVIIIMTQKQPFSDKIKRELLPIIYEGL
jgi:CubicO group peptidase (beta-lactamase class C family)